MESLPDELLLFIFRYLHKFDLFHSFNNLNQRFQRIIEPHLYDIDLTQENRPSYRYFQLLLKQILPIQGHKIRSLKFDGEQQLELFRPYIRHLINLECLTLICTKFYCKDQEFLAEALSLPSLCELSIPVRQSAALRAIAFAASKNLTKLTLIHPYGFSKMNDISQMPFIKCLSVGLLREITSLAKLLKLMPNLEELNLSMLGFDEFKQLHLVEVPKTLEKLHLEFGVYGWAESLRPDFKTIEKFLNIFQNQVRSITLIGINVDRTFSYYDNFQSLISNFRHLQAFRYHIRTNRQPNSLLFPHIEQLPDSSYSIFTRPRPQPFDTESERARFECHLSSYLSLPHLLNCTILALPHISLPTTFELKDDCILVNLKTINFCNALRDMTSDASLYLSKVVALSPNLNTLHVRTCDTTKMLRQLKEIVHVKYSNRITDFELEMEKSGFNDHMIFFYELSKIFPNLKSLSFSGTKYFMPEYPTPFNDFLQKLRYYFRKLTRLRLKLDEKDIDEKSRSVYDSFKKNLDECYETENSLYYTVEDGAYSFDLCRPDLDIWL